MRTEFATVGGSERPRTGRFEQFLTGPVADEGLRPRHPQK
jgi:hypothetical protein